MFSNVHSSKTFLLFPSSSIQIFFRQRTLHTLLRKWNSHCDTFESEVWLGDMNLMAAEMPGWISKWKVDKKRTFQQVNNAAKDGKEAGYFGKGCLLVENQSSPFLHASCMSMAGNSNCKQGGWWPHLQLHCAYSFSNGSHFEQIVRSGLNQGVTGV